MYRIALLTKVDNCNPWKFDFLKLVNYIFESVFCPCRIFFSCWGRKLGVDEKEWLPWRRKFIFHQTSNQLISFAIVERTFSYLISTKSSAKGENQRFSVPLCISAARQSIFLMSSSSSGGDTWLLDFQWWVTSIQILLMTSSSLLGTFNRVISKLLSGNLQPAGKLFGLPRIPTKELFVIECREESMPLTRLLWKLWKKHALQVLTSV